MSEQTYFKSKEQMIDAIKSADQVYLMTRCGDGKTELMHRFNTESISETLAFIVWNFLSSADLLVDTDQAVAIASDGGKSLFSAEIMRDVRVLATKMKMYIINADDTDE